MGIERYPFVRSTVHGKLTVHVRRKDKRVSVSIVVVSSRYWLSSERKLPIISSIVSSSDVTEGAYNKVRVGLHIRTKDVPCPGHGVSALTNEIFSLRVLHNSV